MGLFLEIVLSGRSFSGTDPKSMPPSQTLSLVLHSSEHSWHSVLWAAFAMDTVLPGLGRSNFPSSVFRSLC